MRLGHPVCSTDFPAQAQGSQGVAGAVTENVTHCRNVLPDVLAPLPEERYIAKVPPGVPVPGGQTRLWPTGRAIAGISPPEADIPDFSLDKMRGQV